jgi:hypothetical protein
MAMQGFDERQQKTFVSLAQIPRRGGVFAHARRSAFLFHQSHFVWTHILSSLKWHSGWTYS